MGLIPRCLPSKQVSPYLEISKDGAEVVLLLSEQTFTIDPGTQVSVKNVIETPKLQLSHQMACD